MPDSEARTNCDPSGHTGNPSGRKPGVRAEDGHGIFGLAAHNVNKSHKDKRHAEVSKQLQSSFG